MGSGCPGVQAGPVHDHREREAAADRLGEDHHVRDHPGVVDAPEGAGPADARLHLVGDQRDAAGLGDLAHAAQPGVRGGEDPALALHRFDDHRGGRRHPALGVVQQALGPAGPEPGTLGAADPERAAVVLRVRQPGHPDVRGSARGTQGAGGHAVVGAGEGEQAGASGRGADQFEGGLDGIRPGGSAELDAGVGCERLGQGGEQLGGEGVLDGGREVEDVQRGAGVEDAADGFEHHGVVVAEGQGARPGEAVEVAPAVRTLDRQAAGADRDDGQGAGVRAGGGLAHGLPAQDALRHGRPTGPGPTGSEAAEAAEAAEARTTGSARAVRLRQDLRRARVLLGQSHECRTSRTNRSPGSTGMRLEHERSPPSPVRTNDGDGGGTRAGPRSLRCTTAAAGGPEPRAPAVPSPTAAA